LSKSRKIGIFGGTFDPPHNAHLKLAQTVLAELHLESVYFVPASNHALKCNANLTPAEIRYEMIRAAIISNKRFKVSRIEINRPSISYTVDTLKLFRAYENIEDSVLYYIMGVDNLKDIQKWKNPQEIFRLAKIVILNRPGYDEQAILKKYQGKVIQLDSPRYDISSTMIRKAIQDNESVHDLVPPEVYQIIKKYRLYQS
jgi:nicotinate-nucleotide adenylyltransferase